MPVIQLCSSLPDIEAMGELVEEHTVAFLRNDEPPMKMMKSYTISAGHLYHDYFAWYTAAIENSKL